MEKKLYIKCKSCGKEFISPIQFSEKSFEASSINNSYQCPHCFVSNKYDKKDHHYLLNNEFPKALQAHLGAMYSETILQALEGHIEQSEEPFIDNMFVLNVVKEKGELDLFVFTTIRFIILKYRNGMKEESIESFYLKDITQLKYNLNEKSGEYLIVLNSGIQLSGSIAPGVVGRSLINLFSKLVSRHKNYEK